MSKYARIFIVFLRLGSHSALGRGLCCNAPDRVSVRGLCQKIGDLSRKNWFRMKMGEYFLQNILLTLGARRVFCGRIDASCGTACA